MNRKLARSRCSTRPTVRSVPVVPKVRIEITGTDDATRSAIEDVIIRALKKIASERMKVKWVLACQ